VRVLVLGGDGYLGWPAALHFSAAGHDVTVVDSYIRRRYDLELETDSLVPIATLPERIARWRAVSRQPATWPGEARAVDGVGPLTPRRKVGLQTLKGMRPAQSTSRRP
jgi:nucleoside-diphosphate-sugar epimerase